MTHFHWKRLFSLVVVLFFSCPAVFAAELDASFFRLLAGIDAEQWNALQDDQKPDREQLTLFKRISDRMNERVSNAVLEENAKNNRGVDPIKPGMILEFHGTVQNLAPTESGLFRIEFLAENEPVPIIVFTDTIPAQWESQNIEREPAGFVGLFVKTIEGKMCFLAKRMAWYPEGNFLAAKGFDIGLFDDIRQLPAKEFPDHTERFSFGEQDREPFFSLMRTLRDRSGKDELQQQAMRFLDESNLSVAHLTALLFNHPERFQGECVTMTGRVKRIERMDVASEEDRRRFGLDHYYLLFLFNDDTQQNPVIFCMSDIPEQMSVSDDPHYNELVNASGVFYKSWAYPIKIPQEQPDGPVVKPGTQLAPMLVGVGITWYPDDLSGVSTRENTNRLTAGLMIFALFAILWLFLLRRKKRNQRMRFQIGKSR